MAFLVNGVQVVTDQRSLNDVNVAGITTTLLVGPSGSEGLKVDGVAGIVTASGLNIGGVDGATAIDAIGFSSALSDDAASKTRLVAEGYIKEYVDGQIAETGGTLDIVGDSGTGNVDISSGDLSIVGTANQLAFTAADSGADGSFTAALSNTLQLPGSLAFGVGSAVNSIATSGDDLSEGGTNDNDTTLATFAAVLDVATGGGAAAATILLSEDAATNTDFSIPFANIADGNEQESLFYANEVGSQLTFNPSTGRLNAQEFNSLSDIRYKENIELIQNPMDKINALRGVTYDWKNNGNGSAGIIAQEVQAVMPELISETEEKMTVNYNGLTGLLIEAVKELSAEVAALKAAQ